MLTIRPQVSVIVPAFNAAQTIATTIQSVLAQSMPDFEMVICNDASTDNTVEVVESFADDRIRLIKNPVNLGEGLTRDQAIAASRGHWLAVLDADDAWLPNRLERMLGAIEGHQNAMVFDDIMTCHDTPDGLAPWRALRGGQAFGASSAMPREVPLSEFIKSERLLIKPLFPTDIVRKYGIQHSQRRFGEDIEFFIRLFHHGLKLIYFPKPLYLYRVTPGSATAMVSGVHLMRECIEECANYGWADADVRQGFHYKIDSLKRNESLYAIRACIQRLDVVGAFKVIAANPSVVRIIPRRLYRHLAYQAHRIIHSGRHR